MWSLWKLPDDCKLKFILLNKVLRSRTGPGKTSVCLHSVEDGGKKGKKAGAREGPSSMPFLVHTQILPNCFHLSHVSLTGERPAEPHQVNEMLVLCTYIFVQIPDLPLVDTHNWSVSLRSVESLVLSAHPISRTYGVALTIVLLFFHQQVFNSLLDHFQHTNVL